MNIFDLFGWIHSLIINSSNRYGYVKQRLYAANNNNSVRDKKIFLNDPEDKKYFKKFVNNYLKEDGVLALRFLSRNSQDLIVSEVVAKLFESYKENQIRLKEQKRNRKMRQSQRQDTNDHFATVNERSHLETSH